LEIYGTEISRETISKITDQIVDDMLAWQNRPLDRCYPVLLIDAIVIKVRDAQVANRPVYVAIGVNLDGERDVLGLWLGPTGGEGAKQWMTMLTELRNRGVADALIVCCDGLKGLPDAIRVTWPDATVCRPVSCTSCGTVCVTRRRSTGERSQSRCVRSTRHRPSTRRSRTSTPSPMRGAIRIRR
jgi:transposase-like protein